MNIGILFLFMGDVVVAVVINVIAAVFSARHARTMTPRRVIPAAFLGSVVMVIGAFALMYYANDSSVAAFWPAYPVGYAVAYGTARWVGGQVQDDEAD